MTKRFQTSTSTVPVNVSHITGLIQVYNYLTSTPSTPIQYRWIGLNGEMRSLTKHTEKMIRIGQNTATHLDTGTGTDNDTDSSLIE